MEERKEGHQTCCNGLKLQWCLWWSHIRRQCLGHSGPETAFGSKRQRKFI